MNQKSYAMYIAVRRICFFDQVRSFSRFSRCGGTRGALARQAGAAARKDKETIRQERPCTRESGMPMLQQIEMVPLEAASVGSTPRGQQLKEAGLHSNSHFFICVSIIAF